MIPELKACLRRKNKLMRRGLILEANVLAVRIGPSIVRFNSAQFKHLDAHVDAKDIWVKINQLSNQGSCTATICNVTATDLYNHYAKASTDEQYDEPALKHTPLDCCYTPAIQRNVM